MPIPRRIPRVHAVFVALVLACGSATERSGIQMTDSAGVRIATISTQPQALAEWSSDSTPLLTLAEPDSAGFTMVSAVHTMSDGRLLVADLRRAGLYLYDARGQLLRAFGRQGNGPGEFRGLMTVSASGDSVGTWDLSMRRFSLFSAARGFERILPTPPTPGDYETPREAWLGPGQTVVTYWSRTTNPGPVPQGVRIRRWQSTADLTLSDSTGRITGRTPTFNGSYSGQSDRGDARQLFSNLPFVAVGADRVAFGSGEQLDVYIADAGLRVTNIVRWRGADEVLSEAEVERGRAALRSNLPPGAPAERVEEALRTIVAPELLPKQRPAVSRALWDDAGQLWLGRFEAPVRGIAEASEWYVLDTSLRPQARLRMPSNVRLEAVRGDDLVVSVKDSLDVQSVQLRRLHRSTPGRR